LSEIYNDLILARLMPSGAVHTNRWIAKLVTWLDDSAIRINAISSS
jgi:hypothetical protein